MRGYVRISIGALIIATAIAGCSEDISSVDASVIDMSMTSGDGGLQSGASCDAVHDQCGSGLKCCYTGPASQGGVPICETTAEVALAGCYPL